MCVGVGVRVGVMMVVLVMMVHFSDKELATAWSWKKKIILDFRQRDTNFVRWEETLNTGGTGRALTT